MLEDFGIPVPGETILIAGAIYAGAGRLNIVAVGVVGFIAAIIGDNIGFAIGHFGGRALALRLGKYVFLTPERLDRAQRFFNRHGGKIITIARFIEGLRQANGIIAGISGMHWRRFLAFNALGAALWVGTWVSLGYLAGNHINTIYHYITVYSYYVLIAVAVLLVAYIVVRLRLRRRLDTPAVARQADGTHDSRSTSEAAGTAPSEHDTEGIAPREHDTDGIAPREHDTEGIAPREHEAAGTAPSENEAGRIPPGEHEAAATASNEHETAGIAPNGPDAAGIPANEHDAAGIAATEHQAAAVAPNEHATGPRNRNASDTS